MRLPRKLMLKDTRIAKNFAIKAGMNWTSRMSVRLDAVKAHRQIARNGMNALPRGFLALFLKVQLRFSRKLTMTAVRKAAIWERTADRFKSDKSVINTEISTAVLITPTRANLNKYFKSLLTIWYIQYPIFSLRL